MHIGLYNKYIQFIRIILLAGGTIMTRSTAREIAVHCSYSLGFSHESPDAFLEARFHREAFLGWGDESALYEEYPNEKQMEYIREVVRGVASHGPELDQYIAKYARNWAFSRIPRTAAAIMRVAMYEILYMPAIPKKAAIHSAVEMAKKYEEDKVVAFINGILGSFLRAEFPGEYGTTPVRDEAASAEIDQADRTAAETQEA